jgi:hypothetical protein
MTSRLTIVLLTLALCVLVVAGSTVGLWDTLWGYLE